MSPELMAALRVKLRQQVSRSGVEAFIDPETGESGVRAMCRWEGRQRVVFEVIGIDVDAV